MPDLDFDRNEILIEGVSSSTIASSLEDAGIRRDRIAELLGHIFVGSAGGSPPPPFRFDTEVEEEDPDCESSYDPTFQHADWQDGASRVQAGMTPEELGFNARFHQIEDEFDAIAEQLRSLAGCVAEVRTDLHGVVDELEAKISDLERQVHRLREDNRDTQDLVGEFRPPAGLTGVRLLGTTRVGSQPMFILQKGLDYELAPIGGDGNGGGGIDIDVGPVFDGGDVFDGGVVDPRTGFGSLPLDDFVDALPRIMRIAEDDPDIGASVEGGATVEELIAEHGGTTIPGAGGAPSVTLGAVFRGLPADARFSGSREIVSEVIERSTENLPVRLKRRLKRLAVKPELHEKTGAAVLNSGVEMLEGVTPALAMRLKRVGFDRISKLAGASMTEVRGRLEQSGFGQLDDEQIADAVVRAKLARGSRGIVI